MSATAVQPEELSSLYRSAHTFDSFVDSIDGLELTLVVEFASSLDSGPTGVLSPGTDSAFAIQSRSTASLTLPLLPARLSDLFGRRSYKKNGKLSGKIYAPPDRITGAQQHSFHLS